MTVTSGRPPKSALLIAQRIVQDALREGLRAGDTLQPERVMQEQYQTGRGTLRDEDLMRRRMGRVGLSTRRKRLA